MESVIEVMSSDKPAEEVNQLYCVDCGLQMRSPRSIDQYGKWLRNHWKKVMAKESCLMTISDFKDSECYYLEAMPPFVLRPVIFRLDKSNKMHYNFVWKYGDFSFDVEDYGKTWRCWTSRPTDVQREAAPWD